VIGNFTTGSSLWDDHFSFFDAAEVLFQPPTHPPSMMLGDLLELPAHFNFTTGAAARPTASIAIVPNR
jgi:hypothetical protein